MKQHLAAIITMSSMFLAGCDSAPAESASAIEAPIPTAASLAESGTLGDWARTQDSEKTDFLQVVAATHANFILRDAPSTTADDAMTASVTYFRQCMDGFGYSGVDAQATKVDSMLARCEVRFDPADAQRFLNRVYEANKAAGAEQNQVAWTTAPPPAPTPAKLKDEELCEDPCFGE